MIGDDTHRFRLAHCECVHDDLVGVDVAAVGDRAFEVFEIMRDFVLADIEATMLNGEDAGVDPVPLGSDWPSQPEEFCLLPGRTPRPLLGHEFVCVYQCDAGGEQRAEIDSASEDRVKIDVHDRASFAFQDRIKFRKDRANTGNVVESRLLRTEN
jgi:hypothetical protein